MPEETLKKGKGPECSGIFLQFAERKFIVRKVSRIVAVVASAALAVTSSSSVEAAPLGGDGRELPYIDVTQIDFADLNNNYGTETVEPGNLVAFGDSIFSNPRVGDAVYAVASRKIPDETAANVVRKAAPHISPRGCAQGTPSIPTVSYTHLTLPTKRIV